MPCTPVDLPGGGRAIVCTRGRRMRCTCGRPASLQCDALAPGRRSGTCDRHVCARCATEVGPDRHLCQQHAAQRREDVGAAPAAPAKQDLF